MTTIVKIDRTTGQVIAGAPQTGDYVRVTTNGGAVIEQEYTEPSAPGSPVLSWDEFDFRKRFTIDERKAIKQASKNSQDVEDFLDMLEAAGRTGTKIKADDALLNAALDTLTTAGLLASGRKAEILGQ